MSLLSLSIQNIYIFLFEDNSPLGYGIIIVLLLVAIWAIRSRIRKKDNIVQEDTKSNKNLNKITEMRAHMNASGVNQVSSDDDLSSNLLDNNELVAIITAALMAYMGEDEVTDGLVIRSIRKVNRRKQTNELNIY